MNNINSINTNDKDCTEEFVEQIQAAITHKHCLQIIGGNSKGFYGRPDSPARCDSILNVSSHTGILYYEPSELVLRARAGTPIAEINHLLAKNRQCLSFNPPCYSKHTTLGGVVASGLTGPNRPYWGSVRDAVLGLQIINGEANVLNFGGQVIKNVAGYDLSRFLVGSLGTLGLINEVTVKVIPQNELTRSFVSESANTLDSIKCISQLKYRSLPLSASCIHNNFLTIQFSGPEKLISNIESKLDNRWQETDNHFWSDLRDHKLEFFKKTKSLWRLNLSATDELNFSSLKHYQSELIEWDGRLRWLTGNFDESELRQLVNKVQGQACSFRNQNSVNFVFQPLSPEIKHLSTQIKQTFDPHGVFNPNKMYSDW